MLLCSAVGLRPPSVKQDPLLKSLQVGLEIHTTNTNKHIYTHIHICLFNNFEKLNDLQKNPRKYRLDFLDLPREHQSNLLNILKEQLNTSKRLIEHSHSTLLEWSSDVFFFCLIFDLLETIFSV